MVHTVVFESSAIELYASKSDWDAAAAELVATMLQRWDLVPGEPYIGGETASVLRVTDSAGRPAVLKVAYPHAEAVAEVLALEAWGRSLAPAVLRQDGWTWSMLLEQVRPGIPLSRHPITAEEALEIGAQLHRRLNATPPPEAVPLLSAVVGEQLRRAQDALPGQYAVLDELGAAAMLSDALDLGTRLVRGDAASCLLHGDYNPGNLLLGSSADGAASAWRVIDPKPMRGDAEFDLFPLVEQLGSPFSRASPATVLERRLPLAASIAGLDAELSARWAVARSALNVSWQLEDGQRDAVVAAVRELRVWREVAALPG